MEQEKINKMYSSVKKVSVVGNSNRINLGWSYDDYVYVKGNIIKHAKHVKQNPECTDQHLIIEGFDGTLRLPRDYLGLKLDIKTFCGSVKGKIGHEGSIDVGLGNVDLSLHSPIEVKASCSMGNVQVTNMVREKAHKYYPPKINPHGTLFVKTSRGNIDIKYKFK